MDPESSWRKGVVLGLVDSQNDCGACIVKDGIILAAVNEERLTQKKLQGGFPKLSLEEVLDISGLSYTDVDVIAVGGILTPPPYARLIRRLQAIEGDVRASSSGGIVPFVSDLVQERLELNIINPGSWGGGFLARTIPALIRKDLPLPIRDRPIIPIDHHVAHIAGAYYLSGHDPVLGITADGQGDGYSLTVNRCASGRIERLYTMNGTDSFGMFYSAITKWLGFLPHRHEGKILGLSAHGDWNAVDAPYPFTDSGTYLGRWGWAGMPELDRMFAGCRREDVAAWVQHHTEERMTELVAQWTGRTGLFHLALSGGVFANVRLNQRLWELEGVDSVFVLPHMGDGGLAVGAALACARPVSAPLNSLYLGKAFTDDEVRSALELAHIPYDHPADLEAEVVKLLADGKVVGRFHGRAEWGPRALGNRSILVHATDGAMLDWLNERLNRTEFMPFAPLVLEEQIEKCFVDITGAELPATTMTITLDCTAWMRKNCPGAVHIDGTARPQIVSAKTTPRLHRLLKLYEEKTGLPVLINTSFNLHEAPMVYNPAGAVRTYKEGAIDSLAIGPYLTSSS
ncbi:MAG: carbamoyltransferase C-terminal domain-containing protein [Methanopyri archaeon]|jgi:carbamoyltransferase|nr:carbamoyltransferase C-terminal domain-containing protein [Methanopyri archaeon]